MSHLDEYVERNVVRWLANADRNESLPWRVGGRKAGETRAELSRLNAELEEYRVLAQSGDIRAVDIVRIERGMRVGGLHAHGARTAGDP